MSVDRELRIHVKTTSDPGGANAAKNSFSQLTDQVDKAYGSSEKLARANLKLREIMEVIGQNSAPELGHALFAALQGPVGLVIAAGFGFTELTAKIKETEKALNDIIAQQAQADFLPGIEARTAALTAMRQEMANFKADLAAIEDDQAKFNAKAKENLTLINEIIAGQNKITAAQAAADQANVTNRTDLTPEEKELLRQLLTRTTEQGSGASAIAAQQADLAAKEQEAADRARRQTDLNKTFETANAKAGESKAAHDQAAADLPGVQARMDAIQKQMRAAEDELAERQAELTQEIQDREEARKSGNAATGVGNVEAAEFEYRLAKQVADRLESQFAAEVAAKQKFTRAENAVNTDANAAAKADAEAKANAAASAALTAEIHELNGKLTIARGTQAGVDAANDSGNLGLALIRAAAQAEVKGKAATKEQLDALATITGIINTLHENSVYVHEQLKKLGGSQLNLKGQQKVIDDIVTALEKGVKTTTQNTTGH